MMKKPLLLLVIIGLVSGLLVLTGCKKEPAQPTEATPPATTTQPAAPPGSEADLWAQVDTISKQKTEWAQTGRPENPGKDPTKEAIDEYSKKFKEYTSKLNEYSKQLADATRAYYDKYADGEHVKDVLALLVKNLTATATLEGGYQDFQALASKLLQDKNLTIDQAQNVIYRYMVPLKTLAARIEKEPVVLARFQAMFEQFKTETSACLARFEDKNLLLKSLATVANALYSQFPELVKSWIEELKQAANPETKAIFEGYERNWNIAGSTPELKFTDLDGKAINLADYKDKVVLIDFWATWCGPCMAEVPNVVAAYEKYHDKGFEIIGISFDKDLEALKKTITEKKMTWPQFFNSKGGENEFGRYFGISGIPTMWLVGKDGKVISNNARGTLEEELEKLLGAPEQAKPE